MYVLLVHVHDIDLSGTTVRSTFIKSLMASTVLGIGTYMYPLAGADQAPKAADTVVVSKSRLRNGRGVSAEHFVFSSSPCLSLTIRGGRVINGHLLRHDTL